MVKFQKRKLKRPYKDKEHNYALYLVALPMKLNVKIEPHEARSLMTRTSPKKRRPFCAKGLGVHSIVSGAILGSGSSLTLIASLGFCFLQEKREPLEPCF